MNKIPVLFINQQLGMKALSLFFVNIIKNIRHMSLLSFFIIAYLMPVSQTHAAPTDTIPFLISQQSHNMVTYGLSIKILAFMTLLTITPALLMTMTAFMRIIIVLSILRQALGIPNIPSNQIIIGLSLIMTVFVMGPILLKINTESIEPYMQHKISDQVALSNAAEVLKTFMLKQTRKKDLALFTQINKSRLQNTGEPSLLVLMPAFITSELKTSFEIGFLIFLPFIIIDLVVASILMSMGMMMLSPSIISLPFKILFFILLDGWTLVLSGLITSFRI